MVGDVSTSVHLDDHLLLGTGYTTAEEQGQHNTEDLYNYRENQS